MGEFETLGFSIGVLSEDIALFHALYRTSILGRKNFIDFMFSDDNDPTAIMKIKDVYTSRVAEIFNVILKCLSMSVRFIEDRDKPHILSDDNMGVHRINEKVYVCSDYQFYLIQNIYDIREKILQQFPVITKTKVDEMIRDVIEKKEDIDDAIVDDLLDIYFNDTQKLINEAQEAILDAVSEFDGSGENNENETNKPKSTRKPKKGKVKADEENSRGRRGNTDKEDGNNTRRRQSKKN